MNDIKSPGDQPYISVIIPAYNEASRIEHMLPQVRDYLDGHYSSFEIIVVNDGSTDSTASIAAAFAESAPEARVISYSPNRGKGYAVRTGITEGRGELLLFSDADLATPIEELTKLESRTAEGYDIAIASRALKGSELVIHQPWYRELGGRALNKLVQLIAVPGIHDTQCGFKLFKRQVAQDVFSRSAEDGFSFDMEVLNIAMRLGYTIAEVPVRWMHREGSKVRSRDLPLAIIALVRIAFRHRGLQPEKDESE